jgi:hypothetical protein
MAGRRSELHPEWFCFLASIPGAHSAFQLHACCAANEQQFGIVAIEWFIPSASRNGQWVPAIAACSRPSPRHFHERSRHTATAIGCFGACHNGGLRPAGGVRPDKKRTFRWGSRPGNGASSRAEQSTEHSAAPFERSAASRTGHE